MPRPKLTKTEREQLRKMVDKASRERERRLSRIECRGFCEWLNVKSNLFGVDNTVENATV